MQQFVTLRIGFLWFDVPVGPLVSLLSQSLLKGMAPSATKQDQDIEVFSASMERNGSYGPFQRQHRQGNSWRTEHRRVKVGRCFLIVGEVGWCPKRRRNCR